MKVSLDAGDVRKAVAMLLTARGITAEGDSIEVNIHSVGGTLSRCEVIIREPRTDGKTRRSRRIPILGTAT